MHVEKKVAAISNISVWTSAGDVLEVEKAGCCFKHHVCAYRCSSNTECSPALKTLSLVVFNFSIYLQAVQHWPWLSSEASVFSQLCGCRGNCRRAAEMQPDVTEKGFILFYSHASDLFNCLLVDNTTDTEIMTHQSACVFCHFLFFFSSKDTHATHQLTFLPH